MKKLNSQKPFGTVWGDNSPAAFYQDGTYFDNDGNEVDIHAGARLTGGATPPAAAQASEASDIAAAQAAADAVIAQRRSELMLKAIPLLEDKATDVVASLPDLDADLLVVMLEVEAIAKKRPTVLEALQVEVKAKQEQAARDAVSSGLPSVSTATFGTMAGESQLAAQLG